MDKIKKIIVGVLTYGSLPRCDGFIKSCWQNLDPGFDVTLVCCDDGTPDLQALKERRAFCQKSNCVLVEHGENRGIPAGWNTLADYDPEADLAVIFNDDIRFTTSGWLTRLVYFFEHNEQVGTVGLPLIHDDGYKDSDPRWWNPPGLVGAAVGCAFAVKPKDLFSIENFDGSKGYAVSLLSFHEEIMAGFELAKKGLLSYMLPFPPLSHQGGATFSTNPELVWRVPCEHLSVDEFLKYARQSRWYIKDYEPQYAGGKVDRMTYSRILFAKVYGILDEVEAGKRIQEIKGEQVDILDEPTKFVHRKVVDVWPPREISWLDRDGRERKEVIG